MMIVGNQTITYWVPSGTLDRYGKPALNAPTQLTGRWEEGSKVVVNKKGEDVVSKARVFFMDQNIDSDGWLYLGTTSEVNPNTVGALEVLAVTKVPDLGNLEALTVVYLR